MRHVIQFLIVTAVLALSGCQNPPLSSPKVSDKAIPKERDLLTAEVIALMSTTELVDTQLELDAAKTDAAIRVAEKQSELDIATAKANARIVEDAKDAAQVRLISYGLAGLGVTALVGAAFAAWKGEVKLATIAACGGAGLILFSTGLAALTGVIKWTLIALSVILIASVAAWRLAKGYIWLVTEKQRRKKEAEANRLEELGKPIEAAVLRAEAAQLAHIGTATYNPNEITPTASVVKAIEKME